MVDQTEFGIIDADMRDEPDTCGDCSLRRGEECDGPSGSREGREVYDDDPACDCFEPINGFRESEQEKNDLELPGMWSYSDFTGGETDA